MLVELRRVLGRRARAVICDTVASEDPARAERHNQIERIRDPSHVRMLAESELLALVEECGFRIEAVERTSKRRGFTEWTTLAQTPPAAAAEARRLLLEAIDGDAAGIDAALEDGEPRFTHRSAILRAVAE